jgi:hypothetical protein
VEKERTYGTAQAQGGTARRECRPRLACRNWKRQGIALDVASGGYRNVRPRGDERNRGKENDVSGESGETMGDEVYQPDGSEVSDDEGILDAEDTLVDRGSDPFDEGWSPPERPLGVEHAGTTAAEQLAGESLDQRLAEEIPDDVVGAGDGIGDLPYGEGEALDDEVGDDRSGRLVAPDEGVHADTEKDMIASDVGIDGAAASAEEAAVHLVPEENESE